MKYKKKYCPRSRVVNCTSLLSYMGINDRCCDVGVVFLPLSGSYLFLCSFCRLIYGEMNGNM